MWPPRSRAGRLLSAAGLLCLLMALGVPGVVRVPLVAAQRCLREPESRLGPPPPKTNGSGGYRIEVVSNLYEPGKSYQVKLVSDQTKRARKFKGFYLTVEPAVPVAYGMSQRVGHFPPHNDMAVTYSDECRNTVQHASYTPKSYVEVMWMAPPPGSGCVVFRATVIMARATWFKDDGALSYELCELVHEDEDTQPPPLQNCCACNEAKYEVTFEGRWSRNTHPRDFPIDRTSAAFSDIIGASHSSGYQFWKAGRVASEGVRQVAEWGDTKKLEHELKNRSREIRTIIKARGLERRNLQGRTFAVFRVDSQHHQVSLISRLKPSPDWMVGVSEMELCLTNCSWRERQVLNLRPYDAGTKNGDSYLGSYTSTNPTQKIQKITSKSPAHSPFYDPTGGKIPPLARIVIQRQRVYDRQCPDGRAGPERVTRADCATTAWGEWSDCDAVCGQGNRTRRRQYRDRVRASMYYCQLPLVETSPCRARAFCDDDDHDICALHEWSQWEPCSATCGSGKQTRRRTYRYRYGRKRCSQRTTETRDCTADASCDGHEHIPAGCEVLPWSEWSPCSVTCGEGGSQVRKREFSSQPDPPEKRCEVVDLLDVISCRPLRTSCRLSYSEALSVCRQPVDTGECHDNFKRWYYSASEGRCVEFMYSGCRGNDNKFNTAEQCEEACAVVLRDGRRDSEFGTTYTGSVGGSGADPYSSGGYSSRGYGSGAYDSGGYGSPPYGPSSGMDRPRDLLSSSQVINPLWASDTSDTPRHRRAECLVGVWSAWGPCSATCGSGTQERRRYPRYQGRAGTAGCGRRRLVRHRQCRRLPPC